MAKVFARLFMPACCSERVKSIILGGDNGYCKLGSAFHFVWRGMAGIYIEVLMVS